MIYLDNAATGGFKPNAVYKTVETVIRYLSANPGRSAHRLSITGAELVFNCRKTISDTFSATPERVIFTKNCTESLNLAIFGMVKKGWHVITTIFEHNSVLRPLFHLQSLGVITLDVVSPSQDKSLFQAIVEKITPNTRLIVMTAISNVTGEQLPITEVGKLCYANNVKFIVDGAQAGGHIPLNLKEQNISALCLAGHKGLYGIMGSGVLVFDEKTEILPTLFGGTGTESFSISQPSAYPERLESGTLNLPAICALNEGVQFIKSNITNFSVTIYKNTEKIISHLLSLPNVCVYSKPNYAGIVAFKIDGKDSTEIADILNKNYDIAVRGGLHCAPKIHEFLNTSHCGLIRVSIAIQNTWREINFFLKAVTEICAY